ncbi:MAG: FG-GAP repeat protein [Planctomycetes bacterium]|nr:FG-GAP repeat protein [Planctomycetota bacterium]
MNSACSLRAWLALSLAFVSHASAQSLWPWQLDSQFTAPDADTGDLFGAAVAAQGPFALVGAPFDDEAGLDAGAVYAYQKVGSSWQFAGKLLSSAPRPNGHFGFALALDGSVVVAGSPSLTTSGPGDAHVFRHDGTNWVFEARLQPSTPTPDFGIAVAVSRDDVVVGTAKVTSGSGSAYVFHASGTTWSQALAVIDTIKPLGASVAIRDDTLLIGRADLNSFVNGSGVLVYRRHGPTTWTFSSTLTPPFTPVGWARSLAIGDGVVAVGGRFSGGLGFAAVDVYDFDPSTSSNFVFNAHFVGEPTNPSGRDAFGASLGFTRDAASTGELLVVGAPREDFTAPNDGMVHVFAHFAPQWKRVARVTAPAAAGFDEFGSAVATSGAELLVGAWKRDGAVGDEGELFVFDLTPVPTNYCLPKVNSLGCKAILSASGVPSASAGSGFTIDLANVLPDKLGVLFYSYASQAVPFRGGYLCVTAPFERAATLTSNDGTFCEGAYSSDFNAYVASGADPALVAGAEVFCQWATRDPVDAYGSGLSDGLWFLLGP